MMSSARVEARLGIKVNVFLHYIEQNIPDKHVKNALSMVFMKNIEAEVAKNKYSRDRANLIIGYYILAFQLRETNINKVDWNLACRLSNTNYYKLLDNIQGIVSEHSEELAIKSAKKSIENRRKFYGYQNYRRIIGYFYECLSQNEELKIYKNINEIRKYSHLILSNGSVDFDDVTENYIFSKEYNLIQSNLPRGSNYEDLFQLNYYSKSNKTNLKINFNLRINSGFLKDVLKDYIRYVYNVDNAPHSRALKLFIYYFTESLQIYEISGYKDFTFEIFCSQYKFLNNAQIKNLIRNGNEERQNNLQYRLVTFYKILLEQYKRLSQESLFDYIGEYVIKSKSLNKIVKGSYIPILYNRSEIYPITNKFCIIPSEYTMRNTSQANFIQYVDLTSVDVKTQEDIKKYIWYGKQSLKSRIKGLYIIYDFLEYKKKYDIFNYDDSYNKYRYILEENFMYVYRDELETKYRNVNMQKSALTSIRSYINYHDDKYNPTDSVLKIISVKGLDDYCGGTIITQNDLKLIYKQIKAVQESNEKMRLYTIAFEIFILTNMRIGEILSLERDCFKNRKNAIRYLSKTSEKNYKNSILTDEIISLIQEAISFTDNLRDGTFMEKYIFIEESTTFYSKRIKKIDFYGYFKKIISSIQNDLDVKSYYPYNIRHTYIDNVYREGIKNKLSLNEIALLAGNTYDTAKKHYRKLGDVEAYVETLANVVISDVSIIGEILSSESSSNDRPVRQGMGRCKDEVCRADLTECLICSYFQTFTNRIPVFEKAIWEVKAKLLKSSDSHDKETFIYEQKVLARYLYEMYLMTDSGSVKNNE